MTSISLTSFVYSCLDDRYLRVLTVFKRTNFAMPHRYFATSDPRYWAWAIREAGLYDIPAVVDYVYEKRGIKPAFIGHSQGSGTS